MFRKNRDFPKPKTANVIRKRIVRGRHIPAVIRNGGYYFTHLSVYEDGLIDCWGATDLELFREKLETQWVVTSVPDGKAISFHGLTNLDVEAGSWVHDKKSFLQYVEAIVKEMNPEMQNIYRHFERKINGVVYEEMSNGRVVREDRRFERDPFPPLTDGEAINLFYKSGTSAFLVSLALFPDGGVEMTGLEDQSLFDFERLQQLAEEGILFSEIVPGTQVEILGFGNFTVRSSRYAVSIENKIKEAKDLLEQLNGRPTSLDVCRRLYNDYMKDSTTALKEQLKDAYERIPDHQRCYVGDMDTRDIPVRMIIYGEDEIEKWSHRIASKAKGIDLPTIRVPKPRDE